MIKKTHLKIVEGTLDINAFIKALKIPQVHEMMYNFFEMAKLKFQDEIARLDEPPVFTDDGDDKGKIILLNSDNDDDDNDEKIILLNRNDYYATSTPEKLKQFFRQVLANPELQRAVLEDYYFVYKPILKIDDHVDSDEREAISN